MKTANRHGVQPPTGIIMIIAMICSLDPVVFILLYKRLTEPEEAPAVDTRAITGLHAITPLPCVSVCILLSVSAVVPCGTFGNEAE